MNIEIDMDRIHEAVKQAVLDGMGFAVRERVRIKTEAIWRIKARSKKGS